MSFLLAGKIDTPGRAAHVTCASWIQNLTRPHQASSFCHSTSWRPTPSLKRFRLNAMYSNTFSGRHLFQIRSADNCCSEAHALLSNTAEQSTPVVVFSGSETRQASIVGGWDRELVLTTLLTKGSLSWIGSSLSWAWSVNTSGCSGWNT